MATTTSSVHDKIVLITGATSGIGKEAAIALATDGAKVVLNGRNQLKTLATQQEIKEKTGKHVDIIVADISSLAQVRKLAKEFDKLYDRLDILINNAGILAGSKREVSADGFEMTFATNHLGHFLLTALLLDKLKKSDAARIINVSSQLHTQGKFDPQNLQLEQDYSSMKAYNNSKLYNVLFTEELAGRLTAHKLTITANSLHPGVVATGFGSNSGGMFGTMIKMAKPFMISSAQGAKTTLHIARHDEGGRVSGKYFDKEKISKASNKDLTQANAQQLWNISEKLCDINFL